MRNSNNNNVLSSGDVYDHLRMDELSGKALSEPVYLVKSVSGKAVQVLKIEGHQSEPTVCSLPSSELPSGARKWQVNMGSLVPITEEGVQKRVDFLRGHMQNLRAAEGIGAYTALGQEWFDFISYQNLPNPAELFCQVQYAAHGPNAILPVLTCFDLGKLGVIPEDRITRAGDGSISSYPGVGWNDRVTDGQLGNLAATLEKMGLLFHPENYRGRHVFPHGQFDAAISNMRVYIPDSVDPRQAAKYPSIVAAHEAAMSIRQRLNAK